MTGQKLFELHEFNRRAQNAESSGRFLHWHQLPESERRAWEATAKALK